MSALPKIFIVCSKLSDGQWVGHALAQDGTGLVEQLSTNKMWLRYDMGLKSVSHHKDYQAYYPNGFELVDYLDATDDELFADQVFFDAYNQNNEEEQMELDLKENET